MSRKPFRPAESIKPPGKMLKQDFMDPIELTNRQLAALTQLPIKTVNELVRGSLDIDPKIAGALARVFNTNPRFWLSYQKTWYSSGSTYFHPPNADAKEES